MTIRRMVCTLMVCISLFMFSDSADAKKVVLQLCWDHQFQFAGYYAAKWQGYFDEAGLEVEIQSAYGKDGSFSRAIDAVAAGRAQFGVGASDILVARDKGIPVVVLASIFQHSAAEIYVRKDSGIGGASDLTGKKLVRRPGDLFEVELQAMLRAEGVDPNSLEYAPIKRGVRHYQQLASGEVDAILGYRLTTPFMLRKLGVDFSVLRPMSYGVDFYGDSLYTTKDVIDADPAMVQAFIRASLKGWEYALDHAEEVAERISKELPRVHAPLETTEFNLGQVEGVKHLCPYPHVELLGHVNPERWRQMHEHLREYGQVKGSVDVGELVYDPAAWDERISQRLTRLLTGGFVAVGIAALFVFAWAVSLRKIVANRTRQLVDSNSRLKDQVLERQRAEGSLRESEERFRQMVENIHVFFWVREADSGKILYTSPGYERIWGQSSEALLADSSTFYDSLHPDDCSTIRDTLQEGLANRAADCECRVLRPDGEMRWVRWRVFPVLNAKGEVYRLAGVAVDITKRRHAEDLLRESERRYRTITENLPGGMLLLDGDMKVVAANSTFKQWFPETEHDFGGHCYSLMGQQERCPLCPCSTLFVDGEVHTQFKELSVHGAMRMFRVIACPIRDNEGKVVQGGVMYSDVTEEVKLTEQLQRATKTELLATMSSGIAHEVNQPLNALKLWTTGLMMLVENEGRVEMPKLLEQLGKIQGAADRIASVIDHMRMLIRKGDNVEVEVVDLNMAVKRALTLMSAKLAYHGIKLSLELEPGPALVRANGIQLEQVVINLMVNAVDIHDTYDRRDKQIVISTINNSSHMILSVEDNGPGFADEPDKIFEPFYTTKSHGGSMGLGLALVQTFVNSWNGKITAGASEQFKGAKIEISLLKGTVS
ncbi:putative Diguanylate cyclase [Desulfovibrio ferrophilus]|uniref:histidine kinase n=2 Tax=Desulfovibrio ferrophilus TaxID=241368 RepID=A0A2Z6AVA4_9BACT|nr:putative Diguanylate cyclase [Desulfovibrio ferrophilus]